jgi:predicted nucleotidyltransferase
MKIYVNESYELLDEDIDFSSFFPKETLCPFIFHANSQIKKEIRKSLLTVASDFFNFLNFDWVEDGVKDVWLVGSLASFNWSEVYSDIDMHIIVDFENITNDIDLLETNLKISKELYQLKHDISIEGFKVEPYIQDSGEEIKSDGIYSILRQTWIKKPIRKEFSTPLSAITKITDPIEQRIEDALSDYNLGQYQKAVKKARKIKADIKNLRKRGLEEGGEFSVKNIAFKALRRNQSIEKLDQIISKGFDKQVSIDTGVNKEAEPIDAKDAFKSDYAGDNKDVKKSDVQPNRRLYAKNNDAENLKRAEKASPLDDSNYSDGIYYIINGRSYPSLRDAESKLGVAKSTLEYRVNSDSPKWRGYKKVTT